MGQFDLERMRQEERSERRVREIRDEQRRQQQQRAHAREAAKDRRLQVRLANYRSEQARYEEAKRRWDAIPPHERAARHRAAETSSRAFWSFWFALLVVAALGVWLGQQHLKQSTFLWIWIPTALCSMAAIMKLSGFVGYIVRSVFIGCCYGAVGALVMTFVLGILKDSLGALNAVNTPLTRDIGWGTGVLIGLYFGFSYRSYARGPKRPSPPPVE